MNRKGNVCLGLLSLILLCSYMRLDYNLVIQSHDAARMGQQIWQHECAGKIEGLTSWNEGEEFASLGIGHFIWYPEGQEILFKQTFPDLMRFFQSHGIKLPEWLQEAKGCPWKSREEFCRDKDAPQMQELRQLLSNHIHLQVLFMIDRLHKALPAILQELPEEKKNHITFQFYRLTQTSSGLFALLDYINFKGEGISSKDCYKAEGWGLRQVLDQMKGSEIGHPAVEEFVEAAKKVLTRRIENAPAERNEKRWLKGWCNRLESYLRFS